MNLAGTKVVIAAIPLKECIKFPGIKDGRLFRKNVRQFMGLNNRVNKSIKSTIYSDRYQYLRMLAKKIIVSMAFWLTMI